jgi:hypothetical protein
MLESGAHHRYTCLNIDLVRECAHRVERTPTEMLEEAREQQRRDGAYLGRREDVDIRVLSLSVVSHGEWARLRGGLLGGRSWSSVHMVILGSSPPARAGRMVPLPDRRPWRLGSCRRHGASAGFLMSCAAGPHSVHRLSCLFGPSLAGGRAGPPGPGPASFRLLSSCGF